MGNFSIAMGGVISNLGRMRCGARTEQLDAANLSEHLLGKDLVAGDVLNVALRHFCWLVSAAKTVGGG